MTRKSIVSFRNFTVSRKTNNKVILFMSGSGIYSFPFFTLAIFATQSFLFLVSLASLFVVKRRWFSNFLVFFFYGVSFFVDLFLTASLQPYFFLSRSICAVSFISLQKIRFTLYFVPYIFQFYLSLHLATLLYSTLLTKI